MVLASKIILAAIGVAILAVLLSIFAAGKRWEGNSRNLATRFVETPEAPPFDPGALPDDLPDPVARYLARSLPSGSRAPARVHITESGTFRAGEERGWRDFTAEHAVGLDPPGFVWDARIGMAPGVSVRVRDAYVEGAASMEVKILAVVSVLNQRGGEELEQAALQRYLAEAVWYPWRLVPSPALAWSAVDSASARVELTDGPTAASLVFHFSPAGDVVRIDGERYRWAEDHYAATPWEVRLSGHEAVDGVRVPRRAEVLWHVDGAERPYYRGSVVSIEYGNGGTTS
jgi:hypothetical protein